MTGSEAPFAITINGNTVNPAATILDPEVSVPVIPNSNMANPAVAVPGPGVSSAVVTAVIHTPPSVQASEVVSPALDLTSVNAAATSCANAQAAEIPSVTAPVTFQELSATATNMNAIFPAPASEAMNSCSASTGAQELAAGTMQPASDNFLVAAPAATVVAPEDSALQFDLQDFRFAATFPNEPSSTDDALMGIDELDMLFGDFSGIQTGTVQPSLSGNTNELATAQTIHVGGSFEAVVDYQGGLNSIQPDAFQTRFSGTNNNSTTTQTLPVDNNSETSAVVSSSPNAVISDEELEMLFDNPLCTPPVEVPMTCFPSDLPINYYEPESPNDLSSSFIDTDNAQDATDRLSQVLDLQTTPPGVVATHTHDLHNSTLNSPFSSPFHNRSDSTFSSGSQTKSKDIFDVGLFGEAGISLEAAIFNLTGGNSPGTNPVDPASQPVGKVHVPALALKAPSANTQGGKRKRSESNIPGPAPKHARKNSNKGECEALPFLMDSMDAPSYKHMRQRSYGRPQAHPLGVEKYYKTGYAEPSDPFVAQPHQQHHQRHLSAPQPQSVQRPTFMHQNSAPATQFQGQQNLNGLGISHTDPFPFRAQPAKRNPYAHKMGLINMKPIPSIQQQPQNRAEPQQQSKAANPTITNGTMNTQAPLQSIPAPQPARQQAYQPAPPQPARQPAPRPAPAPPARPAPRRQPPQSAPQPQPTLNTSRPVPATLISIYAQSQSRWLHRDIRDPVPPPSKINRATGFDYPIPRPTGILMMTKDYAKIAEGRAAVVAARAQAQTQAVNGQR